MEIYSVQKVIGEGSFGRALLVQCKSTQEKYVVKEIQLPKVRMQTKIVMYCSFILTCAVVQVTGHELDSTCKKPFW